MGEAKRRREREAQPLQFRNALTGELTQARNAGSPGRFLRHLRSMVEASQRGERPVSTVPCNGCTACCYYRMVDFDPKNEPAENLPHLDTLPIADGKVMLRKRDDGACVHLGPIAGGGEGCTVHAHRPTPCRVYDCRGPALVGTVEVFDGGRKSPVWMFDSQTDDERLLVHCFQMIGLMYHRQQHNSGKPAPAQAAFGFALARYQPIFNALKKLAALPRDVFEEMAREAGVDIDQDPDDAMRDVYEFLGQGLQPHED